MDYVVTFFAIFADVAQLVERTLHTGMVTGSSPVFGTNIPASSIRRLAPPASGLEFRLPRVCQSDHS